MSDSVQPHRRQPTRLRRPCDSPGKNIGMSCHFLLQCMKLKSESEVTQSCPTLHDPTECSLPGSSVHGILQARVLEWGAIAFIAVDLHNTILYNYPHSCSKDRPGERMFSLHKRPTCLFQIFMLTAIIITIS